jgi:dTDP-4-amino-4,6-dideoxygalactose transaminase
MIAQCSPQAAYARHQAEIDSAIRRVLSSAHYILGPEVQAFEQEFAAAMQADDAVGAANGTDALELALRACGIGAGDTVATVAHTAVATVAAICRTGATPLFVDIDPQRYTMSPDTLARLLEQPDIPRPKAVIPVHLYGQAADMPALLDIARQYQLRVIEDCAQAHGAVLQGKTVGTWGDAGCFSFYPTKNLGAIGDGGALISNDATLAQTARQLREYGWKARISAIPGGINSRLDELQAAILRVKLPHLAADNQRRRDIAARYQSALRNTGLSLPLPVAEATPVYHQYVIQSPRRDALRQTLQQQDIATGIHYPRAAHQQAAFADSRFAPLPLPHTEAAVERIFSLPMYPQLSDVEVGRVIDALLAALDET